MPLHFSAAHSSRIRRTGASKPPGLRSASSSPLGVVKRGKDSSKASPSKRKNAEEEEDWDEDRLEDTGLVRTLATDLTLRDIPQVIQYVTTHMFDPLPSSGGFNSTRIAEILNFRRNLPPVVTIAHLHAILPSPTTTEREIAELLREGTIRKLEVPGRGAASSNVGEVLVLHRDVVSIVKSAGPLDTDLQEKLLHDLESNPAATKIRAGNYTPAEVKMILAAGLATSASILGSPSTQSFQGSGSLTNGTATSIAAISKAASGSVAAVGGEGAIYNAGGRAGISQRQATGLLQVSLPSMGQYLKLLTSARAHLLKLIAKSPYREIPLYLLKEKWDGGIAGDDEATAKKKYRGEFHGVLPSRTRKWTVFSGLSVGFVLEECAGAGLVEVFETGSVGRAVRLI